MNRIKAIIIVSLLTTSLFGQSKETDTLSKKQIPKSKNRYCHLGHIHHHTAREVGSMHFEHWGSLTATDQWHSDSGYGAERSMTAVVYHKENGEDSRVKIKVET